MGATLQVVAAVGVVPPRKGRAIGLVQNARRMYSRRNKIVSDARRRDLRAQVACNGEVAATLDAGVVEAEEEAVEGAETTGCRR